MFHPTENAVTNGDFEEGPWMFRYMDSDNYAVPQGRRAIELVSGKEGIISQTRNIIHLQFLIRPC